MSDSILHVADVHLGLTAHGTVNQKTGVNTRTEECERSVDWLLNVVAERQPAVVVFAGDLAHRRWLNGAELNLLTHMLDECVSMDAHVIIVVGNHDGETHPHRPSVMDAFDGYREAVDVYRNPGVCPTRAGDILCIPYPNRASLELAGWSHENAAEAMAEFVSLQLVEHSELWIATHLSVFGAQYTATSQPLIMSSQDFTVPTSVFDQPGVQGVLAGHIHTQQIHKGVAYPGSLMRLGFGEENDPPKGAFLWEGDGIEVLENPHSPTFLTVKLAAGQSWTNYEDVMDGTYLRVVSEVKLEESFKREFITFCEKTGMVFCGFHEKVASHRRSDADKVVTAEPQTDVELVRAYAAARDIDEPGPLISLMEEADTHA